MIIVHGFGPYFGMPEASPFVMKTMVQLQLAGLDYEHWPSGVARAPKGKVPYIDDDGQRVADSALIRFHIERKYGADLDAGLDYRERMMANALAKMAEEHLYFALVDLRWRDDANFDAGPAHFFDRLPAAVRPLVRAVARRRMERTLYLQGIGRLERHEVERIALTDLGSISSALDDQPFLMGSMPTAVDGFMFGILLNLLVPVFDTALRGRIEQDAALMAYVDRMTERFFASSRIAPDKSQASTQATSADD